MGKVSTELINLSEEKKLAPVLQDLALGMAHDVRNPLAAARCLLAIMRNNYKDEKLQSQIRELYLQLDYCASALQAFCNAFSPASVRPELFSISVLCRETVAVFNGMAVLNNVRLVEDYAYLGAIKAKKGYIAQILMNFIKNAIDASPEGSVICIGTEENKNEIGFYVRDCGIGLSEDELLKVFEAFYTTKEKGTGLGLNISVQLAVANGWRIEAESEKGQGAKFALFLPKAQCA